MGWFSSPADRERRRAEREARRAQQSIQEATLDCAAAIRHYGHINPYEVQRITGDPVIVADVRLFNRGRPRSVHTAMLTTEVIAFNEVRDGRAQPGITLVALRDVVLVGVIATSQRLLYGFVAWGLDEGWSRGAPARTFILTAARNPVRTSHMMLSELPKRTGEVFGCRLEGVANIQPDELVGGVPLAASAARAILMRACEANPTFGEEVLHGDLWRRKYLSTQPMSREDERLYETLHHNHLRRVSAQDRAAQAPPEWGRSPCVALRRQDGPTSAAIDGVMILPVEGPLSFHPAQEDLTVHLIDPHADTVWTTVADDTAEWKLPNIDNNRRVLVLHDAEYRYYLQPDDTDGYFDQWVGRLKDIGVRQTPPGWPREFS